MSNDTVEMIVRLLSMDRSATAEERARVTAALRGENGEAPDLLLQAKEVARRLGGVTTARVRQLAQAGALRRIYAGGTRAMGYSARSVDELVAGGLPRKAPRGRPPVSPGRRGASARRARA